MKMLAVLLMLCVTTLAVDPLDFLFTSNFAQYPRYRPLAATIHSGFGKRTPPGCVCTEFLGCHGPGCMRRMYPKA